MSTLLKSKGICGWCGDDDAPHECACRQVSFCDKSCQKKLWKEHILMCPEAKEKDPSSYSTGDIVKIYGLQSEKGKQMNGRNAEIISFNEENKRYQVIFTMENCIVRTASVKSENLAMHLSVLEGAKRCTRVKLSSMSTSEKQEEYISKCKEAVKISKNKTGKNIMDRLKENDKHLLQAISMKGGINLTPKQTEQMLENGFIDWLFGHFEYPAIIDETDMPTMKINNMLIVASTVLNLHQLGFEKEKEQYLNQYRVEACKKMAPLIMAAATKKRRIFQHVEYWVSMQLGFVVLLQNCLIAEEFASAALLNELDPFVRKTLLHHCVDLLFSNPKLYLKKKSAIIRKEVTRKSLNVMEKSMKMVLLSALVELMDDNSVGERWVAYIGKINIPPGIKNMSHKPFAANVFRLFAQAAIEEINTPNARRDGQQLTDEVQYIYSCMIRCSALREIMGPYNEDLAAVQTPSQLLQWAQKTLVASA